MNLRNKWFAITGSAVAVATVIGIASTTLPTAFAQTVTNTSQTENHPTTTEKTQLQSLRAQLKTQHEAELQLNQEIRAAMADWKKTNPVGSLTADQKSQLQSLRQTLKSYALQLKQLRPQIQKLEEQMEQAKANHDTETLDSIRHQRQALVTQAQSLHQKLQSVRTEIQSLVPPAERQAFHQKIVALKAETSPIRTNLKTYESQRKALWAQIKTDGQAKSGTQLITDLQRLSEMNGEISAAKSQLLSVLQKLQA